jgi:hypothetical protein
LKRGATGRVVDDQPVEETGAIGRDGDAELVGTEEPRERAGDEGGLVERAEVAGGGGLVQHLDHVAGAALGAGARGPERGVEPGRKRIGRISGRADAETINVLQRRGRDRAPGRTIEDQELRFLLDPGLPAGARREPDPGAVDPIGDIAVPGGPGAGRARFHDMARAIRGRTRRVGAVAVAHRELHQPVEQPQRLVVGDVLLGL